MSDAASPDSTTPPAPPSAPPRRGRALLWVVALLLIAAGVGVWRYWSALADSEQRAAASQDAQVALQRRVDALEAALESTRRAQKSLETRAADHGATDKVLREELLGMGERASLLEDAVARLADNRLRGEAMLRLNEAEFLLLLGEERLRLFGDVPAAIQAYGLTDAALAGIDDPVLATLRQTLAQELIALRAVPADPRPAIRAELASLIDRLATLPASRVGEVAAVDSNDSRLMHLLSRLVTIRRIDPNVAVLGPAQREAALAALRLHLELAQAALARPDPAAYAQALQQAETLVTRLFDLDAGDVKRVRESLQRLRGAQLVPELPVLGATLQELRGLRATRSVGATLPAAPAAAVPEAPAAATPNESGE